MAKVTQAHSAQFLSVQQATAEILSLINSRPHSPFPYEIEAIVSRVAAPARWDDSDEALAIDRHTWRKLVVEFDAAIRESDLPCADKVLSAKKDAAHARLCTFEKAIWARPARTLGDVQFLAEVLVNQMWPGYALTEEFPGNDPKTLEELIEDGPFCEGGVVDEAMAALLKAIRDVLSPPGTPSPSDAALIKSVRSAIAGHMEAEAAYEKADGSEALAAACRDRARDLWAVLDQIPYPPQSPVHVLLHAEAAYHGSIKDDNGRLIENDTHDIFERPATRLVEAVLAWFGGIVR